MSNLQAALAAYKNGDLIIVTDDADRENEGDLMILAEKQHQKKLLLWFVTQPESCALR